MKQHITVRKPRFLLAFPLALFALLLCAPSALALPPTVTKTAFSEVTENSVTLKATVNPNARKTTYHFEYLTEAKWLEDGEQFLEADTQSTPTVTIETELSADHPVSAPITGLAPGTAYRFRLFTHNSSGDTFGKVLAFATYPAAPLFGLCPANEAFRSGQYAPAGHPSAALPDCRAYEQASPVDKNGGDAMTKVSLAKTSPGGDAVIYGTTAGMPGGAGAQELPLFRASRDEAGWSHVGLQPSLSEADQAVLEGWLPDLSLFFFGTRLFGPPSTNALLATTGATSQQVASAATTGYAYAGASADNSEVVFERTGTVYVWDRSSGAVTQASLLNTPAETLAELPRGAFAGPYDWATESTSTGGAEAAYYLQDERAISDDGSIFFTAAGSGRLYQRLNPTEPQSALDLAGNCTEPTKACTLTISATHRTPADPAGRAPAAFQVATADGTTAFLTSSEKLTADANTGPEVEKPVIGRATLHGAEPAGEKLTEFLEGAHAVGVAIDGEHVYWADPADGTIGRAKLNGSSPPSAIEPSFIDAGETCFETHPETEPGVVHCAPAAPRYVAVANGYVYWTNTGPLGGDLVGEQVEVPVAGAGTIGRAKLNPSEEPELIEPQFIKGASDPQGIAVNASHIYWANAFSKLGLGNEVDIARAGLEGDAVEQQFFKGSGDVEKFYGVALDATHVYFLAEGINSGSGNASLNRIPLEGGSREQIGINGGKPRGLAIDGTYAYWVAQGREAIGRVPLADVHAGPTCGELPACGPEFIPLSGSLNGLATDASHEHLFWSANGEIPANPGNDLYRFDRDGSHDCAAAAGCLTDLTVDPGDPKGAEVRGVLGASEDGSRLYFAANAVLADNTVENGAGVEAAEAGDCSHRLASLSGECNLYLWEEDGSAKGEISFIARLDSKDAFDFEPRVIGSYRQSSLTPSGEALLFRSQRRLTAYDSQGTAEYYLYRVGKPLLCLTCNPTNAPADGPALSQVGPQLGSIYYLALEPQDTTSIASRNLSKDGERFFFETTEALTAADTDGTGGCPQIGIPKTARTCLDVYEWEAPGKGSCKEGAPPYSPANGGCLYLLSDGSEANPAYFADASASGDDAFIYTRSRFVGQDTDELQDVYDVRVGGGLASQSPQSVPVCESADACRSAATPPPSVTAPLTPNVQGTGNVREKPCRKGTVKRGGRCQKPHRKHHRHAHRRRAHK
jgi:hypothetical protein